MLKRLHSLVCLRVFLPGLMLGTLALAAPALAVNYTVDRSLPVSATNYHSLEDLRAAVGAGWQNGDVITLMADDASLTQAFNFGASGVTINGGGFKITPLNAGQYNFAGGAAFTLNGVNLSDFAGVRGGAVYSNGAVNLSGGANTFTANTSSEYGGAVFAFGAVNLSGGANTFTATSSEYGGAIYSRSAVTLSGGENTFSGNIARNGGGMGMGGAIFALGAVTLSGGVNTFTANAAGEDGGAIFSNTGVSLSGGTNTFTANTSGDGGGAISGETTISGGNNIFSNNSATGNASSRGGAIIGNNIAITGGANTFLNNQTSGRGGAIYAFYGATLMAKDGDLVFSGNRDNVGGVGEKANALYANNQMSNDTLTLGADAGRSIYFYDPITSRSGALMTININPDATHNGAVVFDGSRWPDAAGPPAVTRLWRTSSVYGNTTVHNGVMELRGDVDYGLRNTYAGSFTLAPDATLLCGVGAVWADTITLKPGSTLAFDLTTVSAGSGFPILGLNSANSAKFSDLSGTVDIRAFNGPGAYWLASSTLGSTYTASAKTITVRGEPLADTRAFDGGNTKLNTPDGVNLTLLAPNVKNGVVTWLLAPLREDRVWNATSANWHTAAPGPGGAPKFLHGDAAYFYGGATIGVDTVQIQDGRETAPGSGVYQGRGVQITARTDNNSDLYPAMTVDRGQWLFTGGAIESADGQVMELEGGAVVAFANETVAGVDTGSRAMRQHVRVPDNQTATLKAADGATLNFTGMKALSAIPESNSGGAVYVASGGVFTLGGPGSGAINFTANQASNGGAIFGAYSSSLTLAGGANSFINNQGRDIGGAIASFGNVTLSGGVSSFTGNSSGTNGGAIYSTNTITLSGGTNSFTGNSAGSDGGAIYSTNTITLSGGTNSFTGNSAGSDGGAIYVNNSATLTANGGDITFRGNTAGGQPNAIYMHNGNNTLTLAAREGRSILFYDPIDSNGASPNLTVNINQSAGGTAHTGTVLFDRYHSVVHGNTTLWNGTMKLTGGAWYGWDNSTGSFTVKRIAAGAGLLTDIGGRNSNAIKAQTITFEDGAKISADMTGAVPQGTMPSGGTVNLVLDGGIVMPAGAKLTVDALNAGALNGYYKIIDNSGLFDFSENNFTGLFDGRSVFVKPNPRYGDMQYDFSPGQVFLVVTDADIARTATWTNGSGDRLWNMASQNWDLSGNPAPGLQGWFKAGDDVVFAGAGQGEVYVDASGVAPNNMTVSDGGYFFTGGPVNGVNLSLTGGETIVDNHFNFSRAMTVGKGATLGVTAGGNLSPGSVGPDSSFTLQSGGKLLLEPMDTAHVLRSGKIVFEQGSLVGLTHFGYGPALAAGKYTALTLEAPQISNQSGINETSGEFIVGAYRYKYKNLAWDGNNLVMEVYGSGPEPDPDPVLSGVSTLTGSSHIAAMSPVFTMLNNRVTGVFHELTSLPGGAVELEGAQETQEVSAVEGNSAPGAGEVAYRNADQPNRFWFAPYYAYTDQSSGGDNAGYDLNTPALALGFERLIGNSAFLGLAVSVSWPEYDGDGTSIDATNFTLAAYGGGILPWGNLELDAHAGYGWIDYDQTRRVEGRRYDSDYNGEMFFAGLGLGRTFWMNGTCRGVWLRPGASYDYIHTSVDGFDEGAGEFAIKMDDYDLDIHRVKAGLEAGYEFDSGFWVLGEAYYLGVYGDREAKATGYFVGDPVNGFDVIGNGLDENNLGLGAKIGLPVGPNWELNVGYDYLVGEDAMTHQGSANITFRF